MPLRAKPINPMSQVKVIARTKIAYCDRSGISPQRISPLDPAPRTMNRSITVTPMMHASTATTCNGLSTATRVMVSTPIDTPKSSNLYPMIPKNSTTPPDSTNIAPWIRVPVLAQGTVGILFARRYSKKERKVVRIMKLTAVFFALIRPSTPRKGWRLPPIAANSSRVAIRVFGVPHTIQQTIRTASIHFV